MATKTKTAEKEPRYTREALLRDFRFAHVQRDFLGVILNKPFYTIWEAEKAVSTFFEKE